MSLAIYSRIVWIGGIARQPEEFNQLIHEARALCIVEHSVARRRSIFRLYTHIRIYIYIYNICEYIILIHSNRRPGHHCVRKSNLFHIYTRLKSPPHTKFDDIGRCVLYARLYTLYYRHGQWKLAMSMNPVYYTLRCTPAHNNLQCV